VTDQEFLKKLGESLARRRKEAGFTQSRLALNLNMDRQSISRMEKGTENIKSLTLYKLSQELGIDVWELMKF
jgi:transcriptional regulator with XRE-family HTH domain